MKLIYRVLSIIIASSLYANELFSQPPLPDKPPCNPVVNPTCIPITDHIGWLIAAMIIFGVYKSIQYSRKSVNA